MLIGISTMRFFTLFLLVSYLISWPGLTNANSDSLEEDCQFINEFFQIMFGYYVRENYPIVIKDQLSLSRFHREGERSGIEDYLVDSAKGYGQNYVEASKSLIAKNSENKSIKSLVDFTFNHVILSEKEFSGIFHNGGWKAFYKKFQNAPGLIEISRPGFSDDGTVAMIYMGIMREALYGFGGLYFFEKKQGRWMQRKDIRLGPVWVS